MEQAQNAVCCMHVCVRGILFTTVLRLPFPARLWKGNRREMRRFNRRSRNQSLQIEITILVHAAEADCGREE